MLCNLFIMSDLTGVDQHDMNNIMPHGIQDTLRPKFLYNLVYGFFCLKCQLGGRKIKINIILLSNLLYFYGKSLHSVDRK